MDYQQGDYDGIYQARGTRSVGLIGFVFRLFLSIVWGSFVYTPLLMLGYWAASKMSSFYTNETLIKIPLMLLVAYLVFALIYFMKGVSVSMKASGKRWWIPFWILCVLVTCGLQFFFVQYNLEEFLRYRGVSHFQTWSWIGAALVAILIYSHYKFLTNIAPGSVFPFFNAGFQMARRPSKAPITKDVPTKSAAYFENVKMTVSYRKE
jgi:hypothetical protein